MPYPGQKQDGAEPQKVEKEKERYKRLGHFKLQLFLNGRNKTTSDLGKIKFTIWGGGGPGGYFKMAILNTSLNIQCCA